MAILPILVSAAQPLRAQDANADIFGKWRVVKVVDSTDIVGLSYRQAHSLVGKTITINKDQLNFDGRVCSSPTYERTQENTSKYFRESMHASTENLHLPQVITVIDAGCTFIYPRNDRTIMIHWDGFFFDAKKLSK
jgi:hypothetical protein